MSPVVLTNKHFVFLDIARGLAILEMIHGHCLHALLATPLRDGAFMTTWSHVRGFTAPFFLFIAGFSFTVATLPKLEEYKHISPTLIRRVSKILFVIIVGYVLHLPFFSLQKTLSAIGSPAWDAFLNVDILQCIGVSLLLLQLLYSLRLNGTVRIVLVACSVAALFLITPYLSSMSWVQSMPAFAGRFFVGSLFPLFPYASYLFIGALCGRVFVGKRDSWVRFAVLFSVSMVILSGTRFVFGGFPVVHDILFKGGMLLFLTAMLSLGEKLWRRLPSVALVFGQESLIVYVLHLVIIYGSVFNHGFIKPFGSMLSWHEVYGVFCVLILVLAGSAYAWHSLKRTHPHAAFSIRYSLYSTFVIRFLTRPY